MRVVLFFARPSNTLVPAWQSKYTYRVLAIWNLLFIVNPKICLGHTSSHYAVSVSLWSVCALFGMCCIWNVSFLECAVFGMCPFWNVLYLECALCCES